MQQRIQDNIATIQDEYRRIDSKWLRMECRLMLWLIVITVWVEGIMFFILRAVDAIEISAHMFLLKYLLMPLGCNLLLWGSAMLTMRSRLPERWKAYTVSMLISVMALVVYTTHSIFYAMFLVLAIPMLMTVTYGDRLLTGLTGLTCIAGKAVSDLFLHWDPTEPYVLASGVSATDFGLSLLLLLLFYVVCCGLIKIERAKNETSINLERERRQYQEAAVTDALTRVGNRQALRAAFQDMETQEDRFFLAMIDLDDFKSLNDTFGHSQGDQYLRALGAVLNGVSTEKVMPFRFGGDEFCVLFCGFGPEEVRDVCALIQNEFQKREVHQTCRVVSLSIGVAEYRRGEKPAKLLDRADTALYQSKQEKGSIHFAE